MKSGIAGKISSVFINSKLTPLLMMAFLAIGVYSAYLTPSQEEPQIRVPMADIFLKYPGATPKEVKSRVVVPMEKAVSDIKGVKDVYSTSMPGQAILTVRFKVGLNKQTSLVKLYNAMIKNMDKMPSGVGMPMVKSRSIDDVPILSLTLWSNKYNGYQLRRVAEELGLRVKQIQNVAQTKVTGGRPRQIRVMLNEKEMAAHHIDPLQVAKQIQGNNQQLNSGSFNRNNKEYLVKTGNFLASAKEVKKLIVGVDHGSPVYLDNIAKVEDGPSEPTQYVSFGIGAGSKKDYGVNKAGTYPAVTLSIAKRKGADAMHIAHRVLRKLHDLKGSLITSGMHVTVTRNYGKTASDKVNELLLHLFIAIIAVTILVTLTMGWRSGIVVFASIPVTFALTIFVYYMFGYTLNRITLFALVFVTGIVVDDSIIFVENMHRHFHMRRLPFLQAAIASINEVGNPTILATFTVIAAVLPMAFVSGMMGPYMSPMPIGASIAMLFSLMVALIITPWLAFRFLKYGESEEDGKTYSLKDSFIYKVYVKIFNPLIESTWKRWTFIGTVVFLLIGSLALFYYRMVAVKMLPFANKEEVQVVIDMPEGTTLEHTNAVAKDIASSLHDIPQLENYQVYSGTSSPMDFNGLVRHYYLRQGPTVATIKLNLLPKGDRSEKSHEIAKQIRPKVDKIAARYNANVKVVEVPPGPPVKSSLVAEIYGPNTREQRKLARKVKHIFNHTKDVVDVDWSVKADQTEYKFVVDKQKAALAGVSPQQVVQTMAIALHGKNVSKIHKGSEVESVPIHMQLPEKQRSNLSDLKKVYVQSRTKKMIPIADLVHVKKEVQPKDIYRKNQRRVIYVTANVAGALESPVYAILDMGPKLSSLQMPKGYTFQELFTQYPFSEANYSLRWGGAWHITYQVFRDLGAAFAVVLIIIYMLIVGWFQDFKVPFIMMIAIPLSLVGILLGHWILGAYFTATSMIGMIALAGIMVRNSVLLIDFIKIRLEDGLSLKESVIEAGAVRTRPILLTTGAVMIGSVVMIFDPIFQGMAISLIFGALVSTALTLVMVPLIYYMAEKHNYSE
ncbi:MAG TPA: efflux RND transporter permease subunit [Balneolaceae bacterium]|nr:efflux RND transporter permease subunit [Balneolaceae bacterium]